MRALATLRACPIAARRAAPLYLWLARCSPQRPAHRRRPPRPPRRPPRRERLPGHGFVWPIDPARSSCQYRAIAPGQRRSDMGHHGYMKPPLSGADVMLRTPSELAVRPPRPPVILAVPGHSPVCRYRCQSACRMTRGIDVASHGLGGRGLGLRIERVTRIELAPSAWEAQRLRLPGTPTWRTRVALAEPSSPWLMARRSQADLYWFGGASCPAPAPSSSWLPALGRGRCVQAREATAGALAFTRRLRKAAVPPGRNVRLAWAPGKRSCSSIQFLVRWSSLLARCELLVPATGPRPWDRASPTPDLGVRPVDLLPGPGEY
jgi:hypothetical protein